QSQPRSVQHRVEKLLVMLCVGRPVLEMRAVERDVVAVLREQCGVGDAVASIPRLLQIPRKRPDRLLVETVGTAWFHGDLRRRGGAKAAFDTRYSSPLRRARLGRTCELFVSICAR